MKLRTSLLIFFLFFVFPLAYADFSELWSNGSGQFNNGTRLHGLVVSPDGQSLYTLDDNNLRTWDIATGTGKECETLNVPGLGPFRSDDGKYLIYSEQQTVKFRDIQSGDIAFAKIIDQEQASSVWCNGLNCLIGTTRGNLWKGKVGDAQSWAKLDESSLPGVINHIAYDGSGLFSVIGGQEIRVFDKNYTLQWSENLKGTGLYKSAFIEGSGKQLLVGVGFTKVIIYSASSGTKTSSLSSKEGVTGMASDGNQVVLAFKDGKIALYSFAEDSMEKNDWKCDSALYYMAWTPDSRIVGFDLSGKWWLWNLQGKVLGKPVESKGKVLSVAAGSSNGKNWVAVSREEGISCFMTKDGNELPGGEAYNKPAVKLRALSNGKLAVVYYTSEVAIFDPISGEEEERYKLPVLPVDVVMHSSGKPMFLGADRQIHIVTVENTEEGKACETSTIQLPKLKFWVFDEDGTNAICENSRHVISVYNIKSNSFVQLGSHEIGNGRTSAIRDLSVIGDTVASLGLKSVKFWSISEGRALSEDIALDAEAIRISLVDQKRAAIGFRDGTVKIINKDGSVVSEWESASPVAALCGYEGNLFVGKTDSTLVYFNVN